jgi:predicted nucleotide-binding protein (sugar kinase/HSP70/actin superfamily)
MKVTFPHMSPVLVYKKLVELLGHEAIMPPRPTQRTIDLGVKYSPEFACFPLKVIMGTYIEAIEKGAEIILTSGGDGPCRAGYYAELHKRILANLGYNVDFIIFDSVFRNFSDFMEKAKLLKANNSISKLVKVLRTIYRLAHAIDSVEKKMQIIRAYEANEGTCDKIWNDVIKLFDTVEATKDVENVKKAAFEMFDKVQLVERRDFEKLKVGIVGEIYVVMENSVNMEVEKILGKLGVETERSQYLSEWIDHNMFPRILEKALRKDKIIKIEDKGEQFIKINIGGHAKETVGFIKDFKDRGFDGVIHLMPFGCLPELVTQSIVPSMTKELDIPVLTIPIDEQTGRANNLTRIEAFVELLRSKKMGSYNKGEMYSERSLYGN